MDNGDILCWSTNICDLYAGGKIAGYFPSIGL